MAKGADLTTLLGRIRRRLRWQAALQGAVGGGTAGSLAMAAGVAIERWRGAGQNGHLPMVIAVGLAGGALAGAAWRGLRRLPLQRCARQVDAALDGEDRVFSALELQRASPSPFSRALVADAIHRMQTLAPGVVAPARRPAGLPALGIAALALALAALTPGRSRAAHPVAAGPPSPMRAPLPAAALEAERDQVRAAAADAARLGDARLAALAEELDRALRRLARGTLADREAFDLLRALQVRAAESAEAAGRDRRAADGAIAALESHPATRAAGQALAAGGGAGDETRARESLAASATLQPSATGRALAAAAQSLAGASSGASEADEKAPEGQRRLSRDEAASPPAAESPSTNRSGEGRELEHLARDLDETAATCQNGGPGCRAGAGDRARDLADLERRGAARDSLQRLSRTAEQLRERLRRGEMGGAQASAERGFSRAARGEPGRGGDPGSEGSAGAESTARQPASEASGPGGSDDAMAGGSGDDAEAEAALLTDGDAAPGAGAAGMGNGIGREAGGAPLGPRASEALRAEGTDANVHVADGAGPSRAEVIGTAAGRGFASRGYARMFSDYAAAVEDALGAADIPEGKRYVVRRYFDLIRPRGATPGGRP